MKKKDKEEKKENEELSTEETENTDESPEIIEETEVIVEEPKVVEDNKDQNLERLQRLMAEFDNYRKRTEKEKTIVYDMAVSSIVTDLLGTIDNFERALKQECTDKAFYDGVSMIYKQLISTIEKVGVEVIKTVDTEFNPKLHNAISHVEDENFPKNYVIEELQKGYIYKDKVLRHSLVKVAN